MSSFPEWTARAATPCSTVSCTRCATTDSARSIQKEVRLTPTQLIAFVYCLHCSVPGRPPGYDRVRNAEIGNKDFELDVLEEAYTSEHWIVRIYKVSINVFSNVVEGI